MCSLWRRHDRVLFSAGRKGSAFLFSFQMPRAREIAPPPTPTPDTWIKRELHGKGGDSDVIGCCLDELHHEGVTVTNCYTFITKV
jgi:hypothetical protein